MNGAVEVQYHVWPWSVGANSMNDKEEKESFNLTKEKIEIPFYGSPVISVSHTAQIYLTKRYEHFYPFGPYFKIGEGKYQLFQAPHGVLSSNDEMQVGLGKDKNVEKKYAPDILIKGESGNMEISLSTKGALEINNDHKQKDIQSPLYRSVLRWSNFFDDCIEKTKTSKRKGKLPWNSILDYIRNIATSDKEPSMSLIVHIAENMRRDLPIVVHAARRILVRERNMLPAGRAGEMDINCLRWYVRQPGETSAQKAAANRQRLMAVSRRESLDTLENKILKDFLKRCKNECRRYFLFDCKDHHRQNSTRAIGVTSFGYICSELFRTPQMEKVSLPPASIRPNYVLQNDSRYRKIWILYRRLIKQEEEKDRLWDWQSRTWADIARLLVNSGLISLCIGATCLGKYTLKELLRSVFEILPEQRLGSRILEGSEPGPFLVKPSQGDMTKAVALEVVHSTLAHEHPSTNKLGRMGGHLYLVLSPLNGNRQTIVVIWAVHTAACSPEIRPEWKKIVRSATKALERHNLILSERIPSFPKLRGFVLASDLATPSPDIHSSDIGDVHLAQLPLDQESWDKSVDTVSLIIEEILEQIS